MNILKIKCANLENENYLGGGFEISTERKEILYSNGNTLRKLRYLIKRLYTFLKGAIKAVDWR